MGEAVWAPAFESNGLILGPGEESVGVWERDAVNGFTDFFDRDAFLIIISYQFSR